MRAIIQAPIEPTVFAACRPAAECAAALIPAS